MYKLKTTATSGKISTPFYGQEFSKHKFNTFVDYVYRFYQPENITKKTQVYRHNVFTTWNCLLSDDDTAADAAARSFVVSGCKAGCEWPELCYNDGGIYIV